MKSFVCAVLVCSVGCSGSEKGPLSVLTPSTSVTAATSPQKVADVPVPSPTASVVPGMSVTGPLGCRNSVEFTDLPFNEFIWDVRIDDAGLRGFEGFLTMAHSGPRPVGMSHYDVCIDEHGMPRNWTQNPRDRIRLSSPNPQLPLAPHGSGSYRFAAPSNEFGCGIVEQFDISARPGRPEDVIRALVIDHGDCEPSIPSPAPSTRVDPPVTVPGPAPQSPVPPVFIPPDPPKTAQCYPACDILRLNRKPEVYGDHLTFYFDVLPGYEDAILTVASYQLEPGAVDWLPQSLVSRGPAVRASETHGSLGVHVAACGAQADIFRCDYAPARLTNENIAEASAYHLASWDASPACPGMRMPSRAHLFVR